MQLALTLHVEEGSVRGVALLAGRQAAQRRLQVLAARRARLAQALRPAGAVGSNTVDVNQLTCRCAAVQKLQDKSVLFYTFA